MSNRFTRAIARGATIAIVVVIIVIIAATSVYFAFYAGGTSSSQISTSTSQQSTTSQQAVPVTFGIPVKGSYQFMPIYYARNNSYFANNGIDITISAFTGDQPLSQAITSGSISI